MTNKPSLCLIDANAYIHRAYHALPPLTNSRGEPTGALLGFAKVLQKIVREQNPSYIAVCFDTAAPTFRHKAYEAYKATRKETDDALKFQLPLAREMAEAWGFPVAALDGYEADDVIATLADQGVREGLRVVIVTGDKDAAQLVCEDVNILAEPQGTIYDEAGVEKKFGVRPDQIVDYLALVGDSSDNVPGVEGVGPKTAVQLLQKFGSLEGVYAHLPEIKDTLRAKLEASRAEAMSSRSLVALDRRAPVPFGPKECLRKEFHTDRLVALFQRLEMNSLLNEIASKVASAAAAAPGKIAEEAPKHKAAKVKAAVPAETPVPETGSLFQKLETRTRVVSGKADLDELVKDLAAAKILSVNVKTAPLPGGTEKLVGIGLSRKPGEAWYVPVGHTGFDAPAQLPVAAVLKALGKFLADEKLPKVGQNLKLSYLALKGAGAEFDGLEFDVLVAAYCLNPSRANDLNSLTRDTLGKMMGSLEELLGKGKNKISLDALDVRLAADYAGTGADAALRLREKMEPLLREKKVEKLYREIELPLVRILAEMERVGTKIDAGYLNELQPEFATEIAKVEAALYGLAGQEFNLNSPKQVAEVLFDKLKLPVIRLTKTGRSTDEEVLDKLSEKHPLPAKLLEYRELAKLKSTYIDALLSLVHPESGRVHTHFNQAVTATGRLSSTEPNLQNIPIRTALGQRIRRAFVAEKGYVLLSADYSQIDLRVLAHISGDAALRGAFLAGEDVHAATARELFGLRKDQEIGAEQRRIAKSVNFGIAYGQTGFGLSKNINIPVGEAQKYIERYFARYPGVKKWIGQIIESARERGYVTTLLDRIRYLPEIRASNAAVRQFAERTAMNTPIQGTSADIIKVAMRDVARLFEERGSKARMLLQVHDDLVFEVPPGELAALAPLIRRTMEEAVKLEIPLVVDLKKGVNWSEMEKI